MGWYDKNDDSPRRISEAMDSGDVATMRMLLTQHPEFLRGPDGYDYWLQSAARGGNLPAVKLLVELGLEVNERKLANDGALEGAASKGHLDVVRWLVNNGASINHRMEGDEHSFALMRAIRNGHLDVVRLLVEHGAATHGVWQQMNSLMLAEAYGQGLIAEYFRSLGQKDLRETTPPDYSTSHDRFLQEMVRDAGPVSDWTLNIPGTPLVVIRLIPATDEGAGEHIIFTVGLSDRCLPDEDDQYAAMELRLTLPSHWQCPPPANDLKWSWPIDWLKRIAVELRSAESWPSAPVLFPNGDPPMPLETETRLCGWICLRAIGENVRMPDFRKIGIHGLFPIFHEEMELVRNEGQGELLRRLEERGIPLYVDPDRENVARGSTF